MTSKSISRRALLRGASSSAFAFTFVPRHVLGGPKHTPPSEKLNAAGIGAGGKGASDIRGTADAGCNIVAICDADHRRAAGTFKRFPKAKRFKDFRLMLDRMGKQIDVVTVSTPDHIHAPASMMAIKMGKHVFCQKPLTHSVYEARRLAEAAREHKVATQMGIQGHCTEQTRLICEWVWAGLLGPVRELIYWTDRPLWPQGMDRPEGSDAVPAGLDWDVWLGPAPHRPFKAKYDQGPLKGKNVYLPFVWRGWWDFGTGALGDIGCHAWATAFWALNLKYPTSIEAVTSPVNNEAAPAWSVITYEFPARGKLPPVKLTWYDGGKIPPRLKDLEPGREMGKNARVIVGDNAAIFNGRIIPETKMKDLLQTPVPKTIPRSPGVYKEWIRACKGGEPAPANFAFSGPLAEAVLAGNLAVRTGKKILWDGANMRCTNVPEANQYVRREYRKGWVL